ncbi:MAG TPA: hypothetical protein VFK54_13355 [Candidatus Limnocylindrales bacterium]|nr:hypothetical protein [Candidatus Limnocylindrales bacterium]
MGGRSARLPTVLVGLVVVLVALVLYLASNPYRDNLYNHFVWQAEAYLRGEVAIEYPAPSTATEPGNWYFLDVYPISPTRALVPFPPLPALVLLPFVAAFGRAVDQEAIAIGVSALAVGAAWWMLGRLSVRIAVRLLATVFFALGTVFWWTASVGSTWYFAHSVALVPALLAVGVAIRGDPRAVADPSDDDPEDAHDGPLPEPRPPRRLVLSLDGRQLAAGFLLGMAATARLPMIFGAPFLVLVGSGGTWSRRAISAGVGAAIPVLALLAYNVATTGHAFHPGYEYQYQLEATGYPTLGYHPDWAIEDLRYVPQNLAIMLGSLPVLLPESLPDSLRPGAVPLCVETSVRGLFDPACPLAVPRDIGTSLLLSSPAYLLVLGTLRGWGRSRLVTGALLAIGAIALLDLMHFSQGWVQWGYRFSNDFVPFALPLVALGATAAHGRVRSVAVVLVVASVLVNAWGVAWGNLLGW